MADIMTKRGHPQCAPPILMRSRTPFGHEAPQCRVRPPTVSDNVIDPANKLHHAQGVLKPPVGGAWVNQVRHGELMDVAKPLEGG